MRTCILVSAFPGYEAAALLSRKLIGQNWRDHPPLFLCGVASKDSVALPLDSNPYDWMAGVCSAVRELKARGFEAVYLIMADLGPIDACHDVHLNETIPRWMRELDATYISIRGWDHRRNSLGRSLGPRFLSLQRQRADYWGRYALHPALWRIDVLATILDILISKCADHSAWTFEIEAGNLYAEVPEDWNERTFRVCGRKMMATPMPPARRLARHVIDSSVRWLDRILAHRNRRRALPPAIAPVFNKVLMLNAVYYEGPYPVYFQGFLTRSQINVDLVRFLRTRGRTELLAEIEALSCVATG